MRNLWIFLTTLFSFALAATSLPIQGTLQGPYTVRYIYDGDTIKTGGEKIRLVLIDTPESSANKRAADRNEIELGKQAKTFTQNLIRRGGGQVWLEVGPEPRDRYGRLLAFVYLPYIEGTTPWTYKGRSYTSLNYELVRNGWAEVFVVGKTRYLDVYQEAQDYAKRLSLGAWALYQQVEQADGNLPVRIKCAVYNPAGPDAGHEEIWLEVRQQTSLNGLTVGDDDGFKIPLSGTATPGILVVRNPGKPQLSNKGDTILLWKNGQVIDRFSYEGRSGEEKACR